MWQFLLILTTLIGRVQDEQGRAMPYATVYAETDPVVGTATNAEGIFQLETVLPLSSNLIISFIGYEKGLYPLTAFAGGDTVTIRLKEQPIQIEETIIAAKASKQKNKRKQMAQLLYKVYTRMEQDFSNEPVQYRVVSDVRMDSEGEAWGIEQMIASVVVLPDAGKNGRDSIQFRGEHCKRYFKPQMRQRADSILASEVLENVSKGRDLRRAVHAVDSGVVVHRAMFYAGNAPQSFEKDMNDLKAWQVSNESENETVLTYTEKYNMLGIFAWNLKRHYIVDSETYALRRHSIQFTVKVRIPFGYKLKSDELRLLNMLNMSDTEIEKFRLRKADAVMKFNVLYQKQDGHRYLQEKNFHGDAVLTGTKHTNIPVQLRATQRITSLQTKGVKPFPVLQKVQRIQRENVAIPSI